ncbi:proprotein convertase subtilisin kexin type [Mactra antiquata]
MTRYKRQLNIVDPKWIDQWQLQQTQSPSMNVYEAWEKGYSGNAVTIAFIDDGIDYDHSDLASNYVANYSYDYIENKTDAAHKQDNESSKTSVRSNSGLKFRHGTQSAGITAAAKNSECGIGIAYDASIAAVRLLGDRNATAAEESSALVHALSNIDIYVNNWGPLDDGKTFSPLLDVHKTALKTGVTKGRGGKGVIYTWASGNGGEHDDCNADGFAGSIYTISIGSLNESALYTNYSEQCSAILAATYGGDDTNKKLTTTDIDNGCVSNFSGSTAASSVAAGIIALTLEANSQLTWRDIQYIIVETATSTGLHTDINFTENAAGKKFNQYVGFGLMNAEAMVDKAKTWVSVPSYTTCTSHEAALVNTNEVNDSQRIENCLVEHLEWVELSMIYSGYYRGDVQIDLESPQGTRSTIFSRRKFDKAGLSQIVQWTFMSVHFWGENPSGNWTIRLIDKESTTGMYLYSWQLIFYGTITDPHSGSPTGGVLGSHCNNSDDCSGITNGGCLLDGKICIKCEDKYRIIGSYCVLDGWSGGFCNDTLTCMHANAECAQNICVLREPIFIEDGVFKTPSSDAKGSSNVGAIVGGVFGGLVAVAGIVALIYFLHRRFNFKSEKAPINTPSNTRRPRMRD